MTKFSMCMHSFKSMDNADFTDGGVGGGGVLVYFTKARLIWSNGSFVSTVT